MHGLLTGGSELAEGFALTLGVSAADDAMKGDGLLIHSDGLAVAVGRVYRLKAAGEVTLYLDALARAAEPAPLDDLGLTVGSSTAAARVEWDVFDGVVARLTGGSFDALPGLAGTSKAEQAYVRDLLRCAVVDDLLGPANGPYEEDCGNERPRSLPRWQAGSARPIARRADYDGARRGGRT